MRQEGALWAPSPTENAEGEEALELLEQSRGLLLLILLGVVMQLRSLELERRRILGEEVCGIEQLQLSASLLSVWALMGFDRQAARLPDPCGRSLSSASLAIGMIRLLRQLGPRTAGEELDDITEPPG